MPENRKNVRKKGEEQKQVLGPGGGMHSKELGVSVQPASQIP